MIQTWLRKYIPYVLIVLGVLTLGVGTLYSMKVNQTQLNAEQEFLSINPPPQARRIRPTSSSARSGAVSEEYRADLSYQQLRIYYDNELKNHGWIFNREGATAFGYPWDAERTGKELFYDKGIYLAKIEYPGPLESQACACTYEFTIEWHSLNIDGIVRRLATRFRRS